MEPSICQQSRSVDSIRGIPHDLTAEKVVFLPDACPGKSPLPTGTAVLTHQQRETVCSFRLWMRNELGAVHRRRTRP